LPASCSFRECIIQRRWVVNASLLSHAHARSEQSSFLCGMPRTHPPPCSHHHSNFCAAGEAPTDQGIHSITLISGTNGVKNGVKGCPTRCPLHRVDHAKCNETCCPTPPFLLPLLQAQNIASSKWLPTIYAPGLSKTATYAAYYMDRFNYKYGPPSYFLLASSLL
jgi:hypothetical protein